MAFEIKKYHLNSRVEDKRRFNIDDLEHYSLMLQLGEDSFQVCITDTRSDACLLLEDFQILTNDREDTLKFLRQLFEGHNYLLANFWKSVTLSVINNRFTFVPEAYFSETHLQDYLKFGSQTDTGKCSFHYSTISEIGAVSVFSVEKDLLDFLSSIYIKVQYKVIHQSCSLVRSLMKEARPMIHPIYVNLGQQHMQVMVMEGNTLLFYNQFRIKNPSDVIRYVMLVANEFGVDFKNTGVVVWSTFPNDSVYMKELNQYVRQVKPGQSPSFIKFSYEFDEIEDHHFRDVFGIYLWA